MTSSLNTIVYGLTFKEETKKNYYFASSIRSEELNS